ncbi:MAG: hypothetical protein WDN49_02055 [Acetobacteraceae bacterium]
MLLLNAVALLLALLPLPGVGLVLALLVSGWAIGARAVRRGGDAAHGPSGGAGAVSPPARRGAGPRHAAWRWRRRCRV